MSSNLSASKKVMQTYLSELLTEEASEAEQDYHVPTLEVEKENLADLLKKVNEPQTLSPPLVSTKSLAKTYDVDRETYISDRDNAHSLTPNAAIEKEVVKSESSYRQGSFQAMFFEVAGLLVAVPLIELGGIHNVDKTTPLLGKPDWFKGVMLHREEKVNMVDTALWIMPEKCDQKLVDSLNYQYVIMLNESSWGLMAEKLVDTVTLEHEDVKWQNNGTKRPWLAGLVKNRMCALLDVGSLIKLLEEGAGINR